MLFISRSLAKNKLSLWMDEHQVKHLVGKYIEISQYSLSIKLYIEKNASTLNSLKKMS